MTNRKTALIIPGLGENRSCYAKTVDFLRSRGYASLFVPLNEFDLEKSISGGDPLEEIATKIARAAFERDLKFGFCLSFSLGASIAMQLDQGVFENNATQLLIDPIVIASRERMRSIEISNMTLRKTCQLGYPSEWESWEEEDRIAKRRSLNLWTNSEIASLLCCESGITLDHRAFLDNSRNFFLIPSKSNLSGVDWSKEQPFPNLLRLLGGHEILRENHASVHRTIEVLLGARRPGSAIAKSGFVRLKKHKWGRL